jgi:integrase
LRHTFASVTISQGLNIKAISAVLGHEKTSTTLDIYGHLLPGDTETITTAVAAYYGL